MGNARAISCVGVAHAYGQGVPIDCAEAVLWYTRAADLGSEHAMFNLGNCYENGDGVAKDAEKAVVWFQRAAEKGNANAMCMLGWRFENGGVAKDAKKAVEWYQRAADKGNEHAMFNLGVCYNNGNGVAKDEKKAVEWYQRAADNCSAGAMFCLGVCYQNGDGVVKDAKKAVEWFQRAADKGSENAIYNLGWCHQNGVGVAKDAKKAVEWYQRAADLGSVDAMVNLGVCYENGDGVVKNAKKAVEWYQRAADKGDKDAMVNLGACYRNGFGVATDAKKAAEWYYCANTTQATPSPAASAEPPACAASSGSPHVESATLKEHQAENALLHESVALKLREAMAEIAALRNQLTTLSRKVAQVVVPAQIDAAELQFGEQKIEIGRGAAAAVYAATLRGEAVAVKEMHGRADAIRDAAAQELAIAKRLVGHANIVTTFGVVQQADRLSLVMERLPLTLADALHGALGKAAVVLTAAQRLAIAHGVASGLRFCHAQTPPVLHRDLKPGNVLLSSDLRVVKLCDFGSARALADAAAMTIGVGTTQYMAPEVLNPPEDGGAAPYDAKVDVYSFGVLLWELFSAARPFANLQAAQVPMAVCVKQARPSPDPAAMPAPVLALMKRCWAAEPRLRPAIVAALVPIADEWKRVDEAAKQEAAARDECVMCFDAARTTALAPCGHVCSCDDCAGDLQQCPICRRAIDDRLKVFHA